MPVNSPGVICSTACPLCSTVVSLIMKRDNVPFFPIYRHHCFFSFCKNKIPFFSAFFLMRFRILIFYWESIMRVYRIFFSRITWIRIRSEIQQSQRRQLYNIRVYIYIYITRHSVISDPFVRSEQSAFRRFKCQKIFVSVVVCSFPKQSDFVCIFVDKSTEKIRILRKAISVFWVK